MKLLFVQASNLLTNYHVLCVKSLKLKFVARETSAINGLTGQSLFKDHAQSQKHDNAMALLKREQAKEKNFDVTTYAPIAQSLNVLSDDERESLILLIL